MNGYQTRLRSTVVSWSFWAEELVLKAIRCSNKKRISKMNPMKSHPFWIYIEWNQFEIFAWDGNWDVCVCVSDMRPTKADACCPQQQSRWLHHPSHTRIAAEAEAPANGWRRPRDTPGTPGTGVFQLGGKKKWRACSRAARRRRLVHQVMLNRAETVLAARVGLLRRFSKTPAQTQGHRKFPERLNISVRIGMPLQDLQVWKKPLLIIIIIIITWYLIEQRGKSFLASDFKTLTLVIDSLGFLHSLTGPLQHI